MRTIQQLEIAHGDFLMRATINGDSSTDALLKANGCVLTVSERSSNHRVAELSGAIAMRMLWLVRSYQEQTIEAHTFNCYNAARFLLGTATALAWEDGMQEHGERHYVHDALRHMDTPFLFQICGTYFEPNAASKHAVLHAGLVLGTDATGEPIIFDKDCHRALRLGPWANIWPAYFDRCNDRYIAAKYVTCSEQRIA